MDNYTKYFTLEGKLKYKLTGETDEAYAKRIADKFNYYKIII